MYLTLPYFILSLHTDMRPYTRIVHTYTHTYTLTQLRPGPVAALWGLIPIALPALFFSTSLTMAMT
jgi:hypothetical protein